MYVYEVQLPAGTVIVTGHVMDVPVVAVVYCQGVAGLPAVVMSLTPV